MKFILIVAIVSFNVTGPSSQIAVEFNSYAACAKAANGWMAKLREFQPRWVGVRAICVPKG